MEKAPGRDPADSIPPQEIIDARREISDGKGGVSDGKSVVAISAEYSGPLPTPKDFADYGEVLEDAPERILAMAEKSADAHNRALNSHTESNAAKVHYIGLVSLIWTIGALVFAGVLVIQGYPVYAILPLIMTGGPRFLKSVRDIFKSDGP